VKELLDTKHNPETQTNLSTPPLIIDDDTLIITIIHNNNNEQRLTVKLLTNYLQKWILLRPNKHFQPSAP
jgi:hypothetical protein